MEKNAKIYENYITHLGSSVNEINYVDVGTSFEIELTVRDY